MRLVLAIIAVLVLPAWGSCQRRGDVPVADPPPMCRIPCTPSLTDTGIRWDGDPESAESWDELGKVVLPALSDQSLTCERRRQACVDFIDALQSKGVFRGSKP